jgi:hypothetical protein
MNFLWQFSNAAQHVEGRYTADRSAFDRIQGAFVTLAKLGCSLRL